MLFIDLDKELELPKIDLLFQGQINIKKNGRIIVRNSALEDIDTISEQDLEYILKNFKQYISPILTSGYIPNENLMRIIEKYAPEFKVRFKTEKPGTSKIVPISPDEYFEGERIFNSIIDGTNNSWTERQKFKHLYNQIGINLSADLNVMSHTLNAKFHEEYSRNIFTSISKNWGICASFAGSYDYLCYRLGIDSTILSEEGHDYVMITDSNNRDYLTDPTYDSARLKFGLRTKNYAVPKEVFEKNSEGNLHDLSQTEAIDLEFLSIEDKKLEEIDRSIGYLDNFGGNYTDEALSRLANDLDGNNFNEKAINFIEKIKDIKAIGRPTDSDYVFVIKWILSKSKDRKFAKSINVTSYAYEDTKELPRKILFRVVEEDGNKRYYDFDYKTKEYKEIKELNLNDVNRELSL